MYMQRTTSGAAGNGLGATMNYLRRITSTASNNGLKTTTIPPCSVAAFVVNSEPHTGAHPSARLCVGPELARCVHIFDGHDLFGHRSSLAMVGESLDWADHRFNLSGEPRPGQARPQRAFTHAKRALGP